MTDQERLEAVLAANKDRIEDSIPRGEEQLASGVSLPTLDEVCRRADLIERLKAFAKDCVEHGDMTPSCARMLDSILELY